jgi:hypothetical protein
MAALRDCELSAINAILTNGELVNFHLWWVMTIIHPSLNRWWIAVGAIVGLALTTTDASYGESARCAGPTVVGRAMRVRPEGFSDHKRIDEKGVDLNADRGPSSAAAQICNECCDDCRDSCSQSLVGFSSKAGDDIRDGRNGRATTSGRTATRLRALVTRLHRGLWPSRPRATLTKELLGDPDDDKASDDPNDDDDAYEDLDVYDNTNVPIVAWLAEPVPFLAAPQGATETWVAPSLTRSRALQRLRC